jgi:hypothetical protein
MRVSRGLKRKRDAGRRRNGGPGRPLSIDAARSAPTCCGRTAFRQHTWDHALRTVTCNAVASATSAPCENGNFMRLSQYTTVVCRTPRGVGSKRSQGARQRFRIDRVTSSRAVPATGKQSELMPTDTSQYPQTGARCSATQAISDPSPTGRARRGVRARPAGSL